VEDDLQQEVAELVAKRGGIAAIDGVEDLVGFLEHVGAERRVSLLAIPGTAAGGPQARHDVDQSSERIDGSGVGHARALAVASPGVNAMGHRQRACLAHAGDLPRRRMARIEMYTTPSCPFCVRAKRLLDERELAYEEIDVSGDATLRAQVMERSGGRRTVPQIFIDGRSIGGYEELADLDASGELATLTRVA
jgi:glutaredoxin 3